MIVLVRHGETEWNVLGKRQGQKNSPLTQLGISQAQDLADIYTKLCPSRLYASPLGRVVDTLKIMGVEDRAIFDDRLMEMNFGDAEGTIAKKKHNLWTLSFPNGESYMSVYKRAGEFLMRILPTDETIMIVAHETMNRMLVGYLLQLPPEKIIKLKQPNGLIWLL